MPSSSSFQWLSLIGLIWLQAFNGTNTTFPAYSSQLKQLLSISQLQLNDLAFASDAGKVFGFLSGFASLYLPLWLVLLIGACLGLVGYGVQYLFLTNYITSLNYPTIFFLTVVAGNSICWINTVCYVVAIKNFPCFQQVAVGISTSYQGLSAKIYTVIVDALFSSLRNQQAKAYLLLNSLVPLLFCVISSPLTRDVSVGNDGDHQSRGWFLVMFAITTCTGIYAVIGSLCSKAVGLSARGNVIGIFAFLSAPLVIPISEKIREALASKKTTKVYHFTKEENFCWIDGRIESGVVKERHDKCDQNREDDVCKEEIGASLIVKRVEFWLHFMSYLFGATLGLVYLNNLGQIAESRGCSKTSSLVSLSSSFSFFGRLLPSLLDYFLPRGRYSLSRLTSIPTLMAPMAGSFLLLLNPSNTCLYISTAIIGICTGAITTISVSITTELFGKKNFSVNHNIVVANIPIGSFVFGYLAAVIYRRQGNGRRDGKCMGMLCYRDSFMIWGSLCIFGTFLALILCFRMRKKFPNRTLEDGPVVQMTIIN